MLGLGKCGQERSL